MSSWEPLKVPDKEKKAQLWKKIKRLEGKLADKNEVIIGLEKELKEVQVKFDKVKNDNHNLKISNSMLKKRKTS